MLALYRSGRQADALDAFRAARRELMDELGLEPSTSLLQLERAILQHDPLLLEPEPADAPVVWETPAPERSILVAPTEPARIQGLLAVAEPLTKRPRRELILSALVDEGAELRRRRWSSSLRGLRSEGEVCRPVSPHSRLVIAAPTSSG